MRVTRQPAIAEAWPLVGRDGLVELIGAGLDPALASPGGGVALVGAAGVGRTRLAREMVARLTRAGRPTHWVTGTASSATVPLGALLPVLDPSDRTGGDRLAAVQAMLARFRPGREPRPVLVVDDADQLDHASAGLLFQLAAERRASLLLTLRAGAPAPQPVTALWISELVERLEVPALRDADVDALLACALDGGWLDPVSAGEIRRICAGNPLLLRELLRAGHATGALRRNGMWRWREPPATSYVTSRLTDVVRAQLVTLDPPLVALAELLACGEPLPVPLLAGLTSTATVVEAERLALITTESSGARLVARLAHPIYADMIRAGIPRSQQREVWRRLAGALAATPMRRREDPFRAANWRQLGSLATAPDQLLTAAGHARRRLDLDLAERLARAALGAGGGDPASLLLAELMVDRGQYQEAARALPPHPDGELRSRWLVARDRIGYWGASRPIEPGQRPAGLALQPAGKEPAAAAARSWLLIAAGRNRQALPLAVQVGQLADAPPEAANGAAAAAVAAAGLLGRHQQVRDLLVPALATARRLRDRHPWGVYQVAAGGCLALLATGQLTLAGELADRSYQDAVELAGRLGRAATPVVGTAAAICGIVAKAQGRVRTALTRLTEAATLLADWPTYRLERLYLAELAATHAVLGDLDQAVARLEQADRHRDSPVRLLDAWVERARAWTAAANGEAGRATALAQHAASLAHATEQPTIEALARFDAVRFGDRRQAPRRLAELAHQLQLPAVSAMAAAAAVLGSADRVVALDQAAGALAEHGHLLYAAEAAIAAYRGHTEAGRPTRANLSLVRATALVRDCDGARTPLLVSNGLEAVLTPRERQVAVLAAAGHSGPKIAAQLGLSVRTVNNYLGRAYHKLGVRSRTELAGLLPAPTMGGLAISHDLAARVPGGAPRSPAGRSARTSAGI